MIVICGETGTQKCGFSTWRCFDFEEFGEQQKHPQNNKQYDEQKQAVHTLPQ